MSGLSAGRWLERKPEDDPGTKAGHPLFSDVKKWRYAAIFN